MKFKEKSALNSSENRIVSCSYDHLSAARTTNSAVQPETIQAPLVVQGKSTGGSDIVAKVSQGHRESIDHSLPASFTEISRRESETVSRARSGTKVEGISENKSAALNISENMPQIPPLRNHVEEECEKFDIFVLTSLLIFLSLEQYFQFYFVLFFC